MKTVLFFPPFYSQDKPIPLDVPDDAAAVLVNARVARYAPAPVTYDSAFPVTIAPVVPGVPSVPVFTAKPSIGGVPRIGQVLTGMDGTITGGTVVSRRWLLGAAVVSTAQAFLPTAVGALVYEVTATGPGGTTVAASAAVTVVAAPPAGALRMLGPVGVNPDTGQRGSDGPVSPWLNLARGSRDWITDYGQDPATGTGWAPPTCDANGYPVALNAHRPQAFVLIGMPGPHDTSSTTKHLVLETNDLTVPISVGRWTNVVDHVTGGVRRITFDLADSDLTPIVDGSSWAAVLFITSAFMSGAQVDIFDVRDEAALKGGLQVKQQWIDRTARFGGGIRFLDWCNPNAHLTLGGFPTIRSAWTWQDRVPLDVMIEICNRTNQNMWYLFPVNATLPQMADIAAHISANLNPNLRVTFEYGNELWNGQFASFGEVYNKRKQPNGQPYDYFVNNGYFAAQMAATVLKASGYSDRCRPVLSSQGYAPQVTEAELIGVGQAIAEWQAAGSEFASHFTVAGQLFSYLAVAVYHAAGMDQLGMSAADQATVASWANDPDGGAAKVIRQLTKGDLITDPDGQHLDNWVALYAGQKAIADREQMRLVAYEGMPVLQQSLPAVASVFNAAHATAAWRGLMSAWLTACVNAGFDAVMLEGDIGNTNNPYALVTDPAHLDTPAWLGVMDIVTNPPAAAPLVVTLASTGTYKVGQRPRVAIKVTGGRGLPKLDVEGALPGQVYSFRAVTGVLTQEVDTPITLTVTASDEVGGTASAHLDQTAGPAPIYKSGRYLSFAALNPGDFVEVDYVGIVTPDGTEHAVTWAAYPAMDQADGATQGGNPTDGIKDTGDLGSALQIAQIVVARGSDYHCPTRITVSIGSAADGSGGVSIFTLNESDNTAWKAAGSRRVFQAV